MWIMIIKELPLENPPPKYSIFWSTAWPSESRVGAKNEHPFVGVEQTPDWDNARAIEYAGQRIRVFPHEFTPQRNENLQHFILEAQAYYLVPNNVAEERHIGLVLEGELKHIYEQALLDGANHNQAMLLTLEQDVSLPDGDFYPIGYYCLKDHIRASLP